MPYSCTRRLAIKNITPAILACGLVVICTWSFSWTTSAPILATHIWIQIIVVVGIASIMMFGVHKMGTANPWVAMFLLAAVASHFFSQYKPPSIGLVLNRKLIFSPSTLTFYTILLGVAWYCMIVMTFTSETIRWLLDAMCVIALANVAFIYMQGFGYDPVNTSSAQPLGLTPNTNCASALLAFCMPAFLPWGAQEQRSWWCCGLPFLFLAMVITTGKGGMVAAGCGIFFWSMANASIEWKVIAYSCLVASLLLLSESESARSSFDARYRIWVIAAEKFKQHSGLGYGPGQWQTVLHEEYFIRKAMSTWHARAHNEFAQCAVEFGSSFMGFCVGYFGDLLTRVKKHALIPLTALVIIVVNSMVNFPFHVPCTGMIAVTWLAILEVQLRET